MKSVNGMQPIQENHKVLVKYYRDAQMFEERYITVPNKEALLEQIAQSGYQNRTVTTTNIRTRLWE